MKIISVLYVLMFMTFACFAGYRPDRDGAETTVGLAVVDLSGKPVENAKVMFRVFTTFDKCYKLMRDTDANGYCEISGKTRGEITIVVTKDGYYDSYGKLEYSDLSWEDAVKEHRWTRGVVKNKITVKPVVNPQKYIYSRMFFEQPPLFNKPIGFDAFKGDWCTPYGKGEVKDFEITCCVATNEAGKTLCGLKIYAGNCVDGFVKQRIDEWSYFKHALVADKESDYKNELKFGWVTEGTGATVRYPDYTMDDYLLFRIRTSTNHVGKIVKVNYGIISESLRYGHRITMGVHVNPQVNDLSLEYDWAYKNMMREKRRQEKGGTNNWK